MRTLAKFGLTTVLVTAGVMSNLILALSVLRSADAQVREREELDWQSFQVPEFAQPKTGDP